MDAEYIKKQQDNLNKRFAGIKDKTLQGVVNLVLDFISEKQGIDNEYKELSNLDDNKKKKSS